MGDDWEVGGAVINWMHDSLELRVMSLEITRLTFLVENLITKAEEMSAELDRLTKEVEETGTAVDSVLALVEGLAQQIRALSDNPAALNALADELDAKQAKIAAAVTANTP